MTKVYLIITACIDNQKGQKWSDRRKQEYFLGIANVLNLARKYSIKPIIVENSQDGASYLDVFGCSIVYTKNNKFENYKNCIMHKGLNELRDIKLVIDKYNIQNDDMIIKFTGRYMLFTDDFFKTVFDNLEKECIQRSYNVVSYTKEDSDIVMGMFAIKARHLKVFQYQNEKVGCETEFKDYINEFISKPDILNVEKLFLRVCVSDSQKFVDV